MENLITLDMVRKSESQLKGRIFTELQLNILKKRLQKKQLNSNERTYYYKYIKSKIKAMLSFFNIDEINIRGKDCMLENRMHEAIEILNKIKKKHKNKKILISGSFLFSRAYNDIDVFVFTRYNKEDYKKGKIHVNFLSEESINSMFFSSVSQISISNFYYTPKREFNIKLDDVLHTYELLINHILNKEDYQKELRIFLLETEYLSKGVVLNPKNVYDSRKKALMHRNITGILSNTLINAVIFAYRRNTLSKSLKQHIEDYKKLKNKYINAKNLGVYIKTYKQAIELAA